MVEPAKNDDTVFLVGGLDDEDNKAKMTAIFQLVCDQTPASCKWETSEVKMKYGREGHSVLPIDESLALKLCNQ